MKRRKFFRTAGLLTAAAYLGPRLSGNVQVPVKSFSIEGVPASEFPALPFAYDALEPYIDARTMEIHYDKHHRAYYNNFINAVKGTTLEGRTLADIFATMSTNTDVVRNNGGGYYNHLFFWHNLMPGTKGPSDGLSQAISKAFGSVDKLKELFNNTAKARFGSGWAWLCLGTDKNLSLCSTPNQDNPLMDLAPVKGTPLLALDVWEHAYYLKYQNRRADYIDAFWKVVNWDEVNRRYILASG